MAGIPTESFPDQVRDYRLLMERWLDLVKINPTLQLSTFCNAGGYPLMVVESEAWDRRKPSVYLSAGIHGDEPAPVEALICWAEDSLGKFSGRSGARGWKNWNLQIFPCLNPWGLERNIRFDAEGRDLNRFYNSRKVPQVNAQLSLMKGREYDLAITLHEDYDARGFYLYEVSAARPHWGESLCSEISPILPTDPRKKIDGHAARNGLIRRKVNEKIMKGHPEAFLLHFLHAKRTFTLETPSEEALARRVRLQRKFLEVALKKLKLSMASLKKTV